MLKNKILVLFISILILKNVNIVLATEKTYNYPDDIYSQEIKFIIDESYVVVNSQIKEINHKTYITNDNISMMPLREICKLYNIDNNIVWNEDNKSITLNIGKREVIFINNSNKIFINSIETEQIGNSYINDSGIFYVPIRSFAIAFGIDLFWIEESKMPVFNLLNRF